MVGARANLSVVKGVELIFTSAIFSSWFGASREGLTSAAAGGAGGGGTIFLTGVDAGDHSIVNGTGIFSGRIRLGGRSGCTRVCGAGVIRAICLGIV